MSYGKTMTRYTIKRIYEPTKDDDGYRVLVDRLWPRGISKEKAALDEWAKDIAPSDNLRHWFGHDPARFAEFSRRYGVELAQSLTLTEHLTVWSSYKIVTLLYGARDEQHNQAIVLRDFLQKQNAAEL